MMRNTRNALLAGAAIVLLGGGIAIAAIERQPSVHETAPSMIEARNTGGKFFREFDTNGDGKVTRDEMNAVLVQRFAALGHGAGLSADEYADEAVRARQNSLQMFHRLDWNGDGKLSLEEYSTPERARFAKLDRDGFGVVSCRPAGSADNADDGAHHARGRGAGLAKFCAEYDLNKDGKVTRAEFDQAVAQRFAALTKGAPAMSAEQYAADADAHLHEASLKTFKRLDADHDGKLTLEEFSAPDVKKFTRLDRNGDGVVTKDETAVQNRDCVARGEKKHKHS